MKRFAFAIPLALALAAVALPGVARAAPPSNDDFANATVISSLPFSDSMDTTEATTQPGEPGGCSNGSVTAWYTFTPASDGAFKVDTSASSYTNVISVYSGSSLNTLTLLGCGYSFQPVTFHASSGTTYYIQVASYFSSGGNLQLTFSQVPPPPNDAFANATNVNPLLLPFTDAETGLAATLEAGEPPVLCNSFGPASNSWWYSFTPDATGSYSITINSGGAAIVGVYTGGAIGSLQEQTCRALGGSRQILFRGDERSHLFDSGGGLLRGCLWARELHA